jgi:hypothetical protein
LKIDDAIKQNCGDFVAAVDRSGASAGANLSIRVQVGSAQSSPREAVGDLLTESPTLQHLFDQTVQAAYRDARGDAVVETSLFDSIFSTNCPWSATQILDPNFLP